MGRGETLGLVVMDWGIAKGAPNPRYSPFVPSPFHAPGRRTAHLNTHDALRGFISEEPPDVQRPNLYCIFPAMQRNLKTFVGSYRLRLHLVSILDLLGLAPTDRSAVFVLRSNYVPLFMSRWKEEKSDPPACRHAQKPQRTAHNARY
jgi:hypothetical protein